MKLRTLALLSAISFPVVIVGCGGGDGEAPQAQETPQETPQPTATAAPAGTAVIAGTINFSGEAPDRPRVRLDRECSALHTDPVLAENVVPNENGTLRWVFVYVKEGLGDQTFAPPAEPVVLDQQGCMYTPHVIGVQTGQTIKILNSDPLQHNIHAMPEVNRPFNLSTPNQGDERERSFRSEEVMVKIKCDVHPWMGAWAGVVSHPYHSVSGEDGTFSIEGLPAGTYTIEAWHEEYGTMTQSVTVGDGETQTADFAFGTSS